MRKRNFGDAINRYFKLGRDLNHRDTIAVKHTVSGLLKLLHPNEQYDKEAVRRCLEYALECRRRVKEQLKKIGGRSIILACSAFTMRRSSAIAIWCSLDTGVALPS
jgi:predicted ATP-dependent Lon-type protease